MKKLYAMVFISLLAISSRAGDLASSFKQAVTLADAQEKERAAQAYIHLHYCPVVESLYRRNCL